MKLQPFESEYGDDTMPQVTGKAMTNSMLDAKVAAMDPSVRVEASQQTVVIDAVRSYYLAKRFAHLVKSFDGYTNAVAPAALKAVSESLMRQAVFAVATVNDSGKNSRTKSLPHTLDALSNALEGQADDVSREQAGLKSIKKSIDLDAAISLRYLNYIRNKWAGHASLDRDFDSWADADTFISLPLLEDALVRLVNAHQSLADLITGSPVLQALAAASPKFKEEASAVPFRIEWNAVTPLAMIAQEWASRAAGALLDQWQSPPGYGTVKDTDWNLGSEHQRRRALVDEAATRAVSAGG